MFDNNQNSSSGQVAAEDIFAQLENQKAVGGAQSAPNPMPSMTPANPAINSLEPPKHSLKYLFIGLGTLLALLAGAFYVYQYILLPKITSPDAGSVDLTQTGDFEEAGGNTPADNSVVNTPMVESSETTVLDSLVAENSTVNSSSSVATTSVWEINTSPQIDSQPAIDAAPLDTDQDGLTDDEEAGFKTNPLKKDSDGDNLNDQEEIKTWQTDPLTADTDGDGYLDGQEVQSGYNPKGPGKIMITE